MPKIKSEIDEIELPSDQGELTRKLDEMIAEAEEYHQGWEQLHEEYFRLYLGRPEQEERNWPWTRACNIVSPVVRVAVDTTSAMFFDAMFAARPRVVGQGVEDHERAERLSRFYFDHVWRTVLNLHKIGNSWNLDTMIDGTSVVKTRWNRDKYLYRRITTDRRVINRSERIELLGQTLNITVPSDYEDIVKEDFSLETENAPSVELVDLSRLKVAPGSEPTLEYPGCPWYYEEVDWTWEEAQERSSNGFKYIDDDLRSFLRERETTLREQMAREEEDLSPSKNKEVIPVKVFYMRLVLPGKYRDGDSEKSQSFMDEDGIPEDVILWYLPGIRKVSKIIPLSRVRPDGRRPHIDNRYNWINRSWYGTGIPSELRHVESMMTSAVRQMVDYGTLRNVPWGFYEPASTGIQPEKLRIEPGQLIPTLNSRGVQFPRLQGDNTHWLQVLNLAQAFAERLTSVTDYTVGRAPSVPNAPRTFRGQSMLLQQAQTGFSFRVALFALAYDELFKSVHALYKKHAPTDQEVKFFNESTGLFESMEVSRDDFRHDVNFEFQLNPNRAQTQQTNQMLFTLLSGLIANVNPSGLRELAKQLYESHGLKNFNRIWPEQLPPSVPVAAPGGPAPVPPTPVTGGNLQPDLTTQPETGNIEEVV